MLTMTQIDDIRRAFFMKGKTLSVLRTSEEFITTAGLVIPLIASLTSKRVMDVITSLPAKLKVPFYRGSRV